MLCSKNLVTSLLIIFWITITASPLGAMGNRNQVVLDKLALQSRPKCNDGSNIIVTIGPVELNVPRFHELRWVDSQGTEHDANTIYPHPYYDCSIKRLDNVQWINSGPSLEKCDSKKRGTCQTIYQVEKKWIKDDTFSKIAPGVQKASSRDVYFLDKNIAPTSNGEPVTFSCDPYQKNQKEFLAEVCYTKYIHPDGLGFGYEFFRRKYGVNDYFKIDQFYRHTYELMKIKK